MAVYTFDTTVNPPASPWTTVTSVTSNGTHWQFPASVSSNIQTSNTYVISPTEGLDVQGVINMPSTSSSYNGLFINGANSGSFFIGYNWENAGTINVMYRGVAVYISAIGAAVDTTIRAVVTPFEVIAYINGSEVYRTNYSYEGNLKVYFNKYTEASIGYVKSGYIETTTITPPSAPAARTTGFLSTLGIGK